MMRLFRFDDPDHGETIELLPWLVNDTLSGPERVRVERHLAECVACRNEADSLRGLQAYIAQEGEDPLLSHALGRINARLDQVQSGSGPRQILRWIVLQWSQARPWLRAALIAQTALLVLLTIGLVVYPAPRYYRTLGTAPSKAGPHADLVVVFDAALPEREVRNRLLRVHARVVDGPSPEGVYSLQVAQGDSQTALAALRRDSAVVFAEPAPQAARTRR